MKADHPTPEAYELAAQQLGCEVRALRAIAQVEAGPLGAFLDTDEPVILYERHVFSRLTGGKFDGQRVPEVDPTLPWSLISHRFRTPRGGYGPPSVQHRRLAAAVQLDRPAALKACSWGLFQVMGENHALAGHPALQDFVNAMYRSVDDHLLALAAFVRRADVRLLEALRTKDWATFARVYNGPGYARDHYDQRMADAYEQLG